MSDYASTRELLSGWGRGPSTAAEVARPGGRADLERLVDEITGGDRSLLARGLGRSYGDAAQCAGGTLIDCTVMDGIDTADLKAGVVRVGAGCSLDRLLRVTIPRGWFVPVSPGTAFVTVGGAIAADVHGKNHHRDGSFGSYVKSLVLITPTGACVVGPDADSELFWATVGGMGLTGIVAEATIRLMPIETAQVLVDTERTGDLDACMDRLSSSDERYRYSVAWVDGASTGARFGRSVITSGDHAKISDLTHYVGNPLAYSPKQRLAVPLTPPLSAVTTATTAAFNELWFRKAPKLRTGEPQPLSSFFYPLDAVGVWNRLYGHRGFTQYQFAVPFGCEHVVRAALERLRKGGCASSLVVLKRFGPSDEGPMSFPISGWTMALDIPLGSRALAGVLDGLDEMVAAAGGRVYLAKDGRLRPDLLRAMYPRLESWEATCRRVDPDRRVMSDLARRVGIKNSSPPPPTRAARRGRGGKRIGDA